MRVDDDNESVHLLPHAPPFRFVSRLTERRPGISVRGIWIVDGEEDFFKGHFPTNPVVPGVLLAEALAQASGLALMANSTTEPVQGRLAHMDIRFLKEVTPPAEIVLSSSLSRLLGGLNQFTVEALVHGQTVARGMLTLALGQGAWTPEDSK